jgi:MEMO1 family protein
MIRDKRMPAVAGRFYEADGGKLRNTLKELFLDATVPLSKETVSALILPHAGFVFSGQVAASGVNQISRDATYKSIFLIGSSHHKGFDGASLFRGTSFLTPLGEVPVDTETVSSLMAASPFFGHDPLSHKEEHSLEVELPFLQYHLNHPFSIVPLLIGTRNLSTCKAMAEVLAPYFNGDHLFVVSTDFSHYPNDQDARRVDQETLEAIMSNDPDQLNNLLARHTAEGIPGLGTSLCGWPAVMTLLYMTSKLENLTFLPVMYQNSSDSPYGDADKVVGYHSAIITRPEAETFSLSEREKQWLLNCARKKLEKAFDRPVTFDKGPIPYKLERQMGAFVSVYLNGSLNGCIGHIGEGQPLWKVVEDSALSAAFDDHRFDPLILEDLDKAILEISVLTPLRKIKHPDEIIPGKHGILIKKGFYQGTFLPQVAQRMNWSAMEMLEKCAQDKAGLGRNGWKDAELFVYEAIVFREPNNP